MSLVIFDGASFEGERVAIRASAVVGIVSDKTDDGTFRTVIMFRSGNNDHRAVVKHSVEDVAEAINKTSDFY